MNRTGKSAVTTWRLITLKPSLFFFFAAIAGFTTEVFADVAPEGSGTLEEVVVTARKRSEDLQKTPVSITVISGSRAAEQNIRNFQDLAGAVPSMEVTPQPSGAANLTIRGLGQTSDRVNQDVKTGLYIDDMYVGRQEGNYLYFYDVNSLQVLNGPQGTLFGKNTTGGAILLTTVRPSNDSSGYVQLRGGNYGRFDTEGAINLPVNDELMTRVSFRTQKADGFINHVDDSGKSNDINNQSVRAQIRWMPDSRLTVDFLSEYNNSQTDGQTSIITGCSDSGYFTSLYNTIHSRTYCSQYPVLTGKNTVYGGANLYLPTDSIRTDLYTGGDYVPNGVTREGHPGPFNNTQALTENLRINYQLSDNVALKSITTYRRSQFRNYNPTENAPDDIYAELDGSGTTQITEEDNITGSAFGGQLNYVGGIFYYLQKTAWLEDTGPDYGDATGFLWHSTNKYTSYAAYGQGSYKILPSLELTVGARYTVDRKVADSDLFLQTNYGAPCATFAEAFVAGAAACNSHVTGADSHHWDSFNPRGQLSYQAAPDVFLYASVATGYNAGGFNQEIEQSLGGGLLDYSPEKLIDYEVGIKTEWLDHRVRANMTAFRQKYSDIQTNVIVYVNGNPFGATETGASAREQGVELELAYAPTRELLFWANGSLLRQKYLSINANVTGITLSSPVDSAPRHTYSAGFSYQLRFGNGMIATPSLNYRAVGEKPACSFSGAGSCYVPAYGLLGSKIDFKLSEDSLWTTSLWGTNLTDANVEYDKQLPTVLGVGYYTPGRPREFGVEVRRNF